MLTLSNFTWFQTELESTGYGNDLESTRDALEYHQQVHREIAAYRTHVDRCLAEKVVCFINMRQFLFMVLAEASNNYLVSFFALVFFLLKKTNIAT